jgi:hypothetical protein
MADVAEGAALRLDQRVAGHRRQAEIAPHHVLVIAGQQHDVAGVERQRRLAFDRDALALDDEVIGDQLVTGSEIGLAQPTGDLRDHAPRRGEARMQEYGAVQFRGTEHVGQRVHLEPSSILPEPRS